MVFGIIILLLALAVAYFHYAQGFFSATLSCIFTIIAAVVAVSYHETVIASLLKGGIANIAESAILVVLFVATYVILRTIFDRTIPGNVRYPLMVDKVGAGIVGIIAGLFAAGVLAIAAEALPFGPSIAGFSRYTVADRDVVLPGNNSGQQDSVTFDEMKDTSLDPKNEKSLLIPVDNIVIGTVDHLSQGSLDNGNPLSSVHPDWMTELFGQRVGVQVGAKRVAFNLPSLQNTHLANPGVFKMDSITEIDGEHKTVREGQNHDEQALAPDKGDTFKAPADQTLLVVRVDFDSSATDDDNKVRFSCASVRLVGWNDSGGTKTYTDYTPIGTLQDAYVLYRNKPDDPLVCQGGKSVDFVFQVPLDDVFKTADPKAPEREIKDGVFIAVKRMAQMDLSKQIVKGPPTYDNNVDVIRKTLDQAKRYPKRGAHGETGPQVTTTGPITVTGMKQTNLLFTKINPGTYQGDPANADFKGGGAQISNKQFEKLRLDGTQTTATLGQGDFAINELYAPAGKKIVEVVGKPAADRDPWEWANFVTFTIADADATQYRCSGAFAELNKDGGEPRAIGSYDSENSATSVEHGNDVGRPMQVWLIFVVPDNVEITQLQFNGQTMYAHDVKVP